MYSLFIHLLKFTMYLTFLLGFGIYTGTQEEFMPFKTHSGQASHDIPTPRIIEQYIVTCSVKKAGWEGSF